MSENNERRTASEGDEKAIEQAVAAERARADRAVALAEQEKARADRAEVWAAEQVACTHVYARTGRLTCARSRADTWSHKHSQKCWLACIPAHAHVLVPALLRSCWC